MAPTLYPFDRGTGSLTFETAESGASTQNVFARKRLLILRQFISDLCPIAQRPSEDIPIVHGTGHALDPRPGDVRRRSDAPAIYERDVPPINFLHHEHVVEGLPPLPSPLAGESRNASGNVCCWVNHIDVIG